MSTATRPQAPAYRRSHGSDRPAERKLLLRATHAGWALIGAQGEVVFRADGNTGRRACLAFARERGVLALTR
jgi:hypothetical protein